MRIIGHRGAKGDAPENSIEALHYALEQGADGIEIDVRVTRDNVPIVVHDKSLLSSHRINKRIHKLSFNELNDLIPGHNIPTLLDVFDTFWGKTFLNIELKSKHSADAVIALLATHYIKHDDDWENCLISSFKTRELRVARKLSSEVRLAMLHDQNPYKFILYHRSIQFSALGFHRHHVSMFVMGLAKRLGVSTYVYTVNRPRAAKIARGQKFDCIITDYPARIRKVLESTPAQVTRDTDE